MEDISDISLGLVNRSNQESMHLCLIYRDEEERRAVVSKFLKYGLLNGEKIAYYSDLMSPDELQNWLEEIGIDAHQLVSNKQLNISETLNVYCPHGVFEVEPMLNRYESYYKLAMEEGFKGARVTGETNWLTYKTPGTDRFIEYEARLNDVLLKYPVATMCQYDATLFDGATIFDILQVHPFMVVHGQIVKNPAYTKPDEFLRSLDAR
jgi:hypothetical protein